MRVGTLAMIKPLFGAAAAISVAAVAGILADIIARRCALSAA